MNSSKNLKILKNITFYKIWNYFLVLTSFHISRFFKKPTVWGKLYLLNLEPTNICNLQCPECPTGMGILTRPKGMQSVEDFKHYIDQVKDELLFLVLYFQGEPFINKNLLEMVKYASDRKIFVQISTNGHFFKTEEQCQAILDSGLGELIMSLDGMTQDTYVKYRVNGSFNTASQAFERICELKKTQAKKNTPILSIQFLVSKSNEHEITAVQNFGQKIGADCVLLKSMQVYNFEGIEDILPTNTKYRRYKQNKNGEWQLDGKVRSGCFKLWSNTLLSWDGDVAPCCFDKDIEFKMGNLKTQSLDEVWKNEKYQSIRQTLLNNRTSIDMCKNCTEGLKVYR